MQYLLGNVFLFQLLKMTGATVNAVRRLNLLTDLDQTALAYVSFWY